MNRKNLLWLIPILLLLACHSGQAEENSYLCRGR